MKEKELPEDIIKEAVTVFSAAGNHLSEYGDGIYDMDKNGWVHFGKPAFDGGTFKA